MLDHQSQIHNVMTEVGWLKVDLRTIHQKTDHVLVLVQDLVQVNETQRDGTITIRIDIPSSLIYPILRLYQMVAIHPSTVS